MHAFKIKPKLVIFFILAVFIPSSILCYMAIRAISLEEASIEKSMHGTLFSEVVHTISLINNEINSTVEELNSMLIFPEEPLEQDILRELANRLKESSILVKIPFVLSKDKNILWPVQNNELIKDEIVFITWNRNFFLNKVSIPVYQNIAIVYKDTIIKQTEKDINIPLLSRDEPLVSSTGDIPEQMETFGEVSELDLVEEDYNSRKEIAPGAALDKKSGIDLYSVPDEDSDLFAYSDEITRSASSEAALEQEEPVEEIKEEYFAPPEDLYADSESNEILQQNMMNQQAILEFSQDESLRARVYEQAEKEGQEIQERTVYTQQTVIQTEKSIFISGPKTFNEIIADKDYGIITRIIEEKLMLIFWKKNINGEILGCVIALDALKDRIFGIVQNVYSDVRILTILDETGKPLLYPKSEEARDWRIPFVALEISEVLPRWEVAAYLTDPAIISSRADTQAMFMLILITILAVSIIAGGSIALKLMYNEVKLAQQKTTFVANVSHELKTPLTSIRMFAEMLRSKKNLEKSRAKKYLDIMVSETERLTRLINNVLDFSRRDKSKNNYNFKKVNIVMLIKGMIKNQKVRLKNNGFDISFKSAVKEAFVTVDEEAVKQVVLNLVSNAEKYSENIKEISVEITVSCEYVFINIQDRGIGVPVKHREKIFKEFYRINDGLTAKAGGSGLGLSIARKIIVDHKGEIIYIPRQDGGSIFQIKFKLE